MMFRSPRLVLLCLLLAIGGCGIRGSLVKPPGPAPEPLLGRSASEEAKAAAHDDAKHKDVSTPQSSAQ